MFKKLLSVFKTPIKRIDVPLKSGHLRVLKKTSGVGFQYFLRFSYTGNVQYHILEPHEIQTVINSLLEIQNDSEETD